MMATGIITPTLTDGTELWSISPLLYYFGGIERSTFTSYATRGQAPAAAFQVERTRLGDAEEVNSWHASRPGSPVPGAPGKKA